MSKLRTKYKRLKEENARLNGFYNSKIKVVPINVKPYRAKYRFPNGLYNYTKESSNKKEELIRRELADLIARGIKDQLVINKAQDDGTYTTYTTIIQIGFEEAK